MNARANNPRVVAGARRVQARSAARQASTPVDRLAERIPALCDATGALPTQAVLAQELGVSRPMLREAVSQLAAWGVLDVRTRVGTRVVDERHWQIVNRRVVSWRLARATDSAFGADLARIRRALEPIAAAEAARNAGPEQREAITLATVARLAVGSLLDYECARRELHVAILDASSNQFLRQLTCLVPWPDQAVNPNAGAPKISEGERDALTRLESAIRHRDADAARESLERLNTWDLPCPGECANA